VESLPRLPAGDSPEAFPESLGFEKQGIEKEEGGGTPSTLSV
jgi:hypothetical protein